MIVVDKRLTHGNSLEHGYFPGVPTPRVRLPERRGRLIEPTWAAGRGAPRLTGVSVHRVMAVCTGCVERARAMVDYSDATPSTIDRDNAATGLWLHPPLPRGPGTVRNRVDRGDGTLQRLPA